MFNNYFLMLFSELMLIDYTTKILIILLVLLRDAFTMAIGTAALPAKHIFKSVRTQMKDNTY